MESILSNEIKTKAILVSVILQTDDREEKTSSLDELERLLDTAGGETFARLIQSKDSPTNATYIGSGKVIELKEICEANEINLVVFDAELSPKQIKNLENELSNVHVIDRSMLILDIFALHATTAEGKLQVELAQLKYTIPRLTGKGTELSRLGGGIGTRGPGETKLETDRRHLLRRIASLEQELDEIEKKQKIKQKRRIKSGIMQFAIVGYTNAGKSTLLNRLTDAGVLAEDKLFATLDTTTRKFTLPNGIDILLTDTVGFIRRLPHHLIKAFRSTLGEVTTCDGVLFVLDSSDENCEIHVEVTRELLKDLGATDKPTLYILNKADMCENGVSLPSISGEEKVSVSAKTGEGFEDLVLKITDIVMSASKVETFKIPNSELGFLNVLYKNAVVSSVEYDENGATVVATVDNKTRGMLKDFLVVNGEFTDEEDY